MSACDPRYVCLRSGLALPVEPVLLVLDLEARGIRLWRDGDAIAIRPRSALAAPDLAALRQWKPHVLALIDACDTTPEVQ